METRPKVTSIQMRERGHKKGTKAMQRQGDKDQRKGTKIQIWELGQNKKTLKVQIGTDSVF